MRDMVGNIVDEEGQVFDAVHIDGGNPVVNIGAKSMQAGLRGIRRFRRYFCVFDQKICRGRHACNLGR